MARNRPLILALLAVATIAGCAARRPAPKPVYVLKKPRP